MNLIPLHDRVIIKVAQPEEVTKGGIIIPDSVKEKPLQGEVVACGPGKTNEEGKLTPMQVKPGDQVLYGPYGNTPIEHDGEEYLMMRESDIFAIVK